MKFSLSFTRWNATFQLASNNILLLVDTVVSYRVLILKTTLGNVEQNVPQFTLKKKKTKTEHRVKVKTCGSC